jgi:hypothetical protein
MKSSESLMKPYGIRRGHILLVSPLTFSYHLSISEALRSLGYDVTWWDQCASSSILYKIALRLFPTMTARWSERSFRKRLHKLDANLITHVLVIKGEGLSKRLVLEMRETLELASIGLYLWDGVDNIKGVSNIVPEFDSVSTFDPVDAMRFNWTYRPLFGRNFSAKQSNVMSIQFDWCFIGTIHSDRHRVIHRLQKRYGQRMRSFVFCYFQSPLMLYMRKLVSWTLWVAPKETLSTTPMTTADIEKIVAESMTVLDIEHPRQRGFTMRTIETLLTEKKLVTTNSHIFSSNLYHPSRVHVINRESPEIPAEFLEQSFLPIQDALKNYYSCLGWATELLTIQDKARQAR